MCEPTTASPSSACIDSSRPSRSSSRGAASSSVSGASVSAETSVSSADDNGITSPARAHVLVLDLLLQQQDALEQRLGTRRAAGHVDVDGDQLVDALGDRVAVPVGAAAVGAATHADD